VPFGVIVRLRLLPHSGRTLGRYSSARRLPWLGRHSRSTVVLHDVSSVPYLPKLLAYQAFDCATRAAKSASLSKAGSGVAPGDGNTERRKRARGLAVGHRELDVGVDADALRRSGCR